MSLIKRSVLLAVVGLALGTAFAQQKSAVTALQQAYQSKGQALCSTYQKSLDSLLTVLKQKGDLDNYLIVETE